MTAILAAVAVISVIILAVTQMVKQIVPDNKYLPIINVVIGIAVGILYAMTIEHGQLAIYGWAGAISGLAAGGFYDLGANVKGLVNQSTSKKMIDGGTGKQDGTDGE